MSASSAWLLLVLLSSCYSFPTESSVLRESTAQAAPPMMIRATSPHPFQKQIGRPSREVDRHVTPVPLRNRRHP